MATLSVGGTTVFDGSALQSGVTGALTTGVTFPAGHILQVKYKQITSGTGVTTTATTLMDVTNLFLPITPSDDNNDILIMANIHLYISSTDTATWSSATCAIEATPNGGSPSVVWEAGITGTSTIYPFAMYAANNADRIMSRIPITYLHSPDTDVEVVYQIQFASRAGGSISSDIGYGYSDITLMEVAR